VSLLHIHVLYNKCTLGVTLIL